MTRLDALRAVYDRLGDCAVVTIMGAVAAELQSIGHRPNFFYLQHAMGLASSVGLGIALSKPAVPVVVFDGDGSVLMNLGGLSTLARYRPANLAPRRLRQRVAALGRRIPDGHRHLHAPRRSGGRRGRAAHRVRDDDRRVREGVRSRAAGARADDARREGRCDRAGGVRHRPRPAREPFPVSALPARPLTAIMSSLAALVADLAAGRITVVDLDAAARPRHAGDRPAADVRGVAGRVDRRDLALRRQGAGVVLEHHPDGRAHRHALRCAGALDHRPRSAEQHHRHDSARPVRRAGVRDRRHEPRSRPTKTTCSTSPRSNDGRPRTAASRAARGCCCRTGWSRRTGAAFLNVRDDGPHGPGFDQATSKLLAADRDVLGVGVETIGTDAGQAGRFDPPFPNHNIMHGHGKFGLASLCNLDRLPPTGAVVIAAPLKIVGGSGSPVRAIASCR